MRWALLFCLGGCLPVDHVPLELNGWGFLIGTRQEVRLVDFSDPGELPLNIQDGTLGAAYTELADDHRLEPAMVPPFYLGVEVDAFRPGSDRPIPTPSILYVFEAGEWNDFPKSEAPKAALLAPFRWTACDQWVAEAADGHYFCKPGEAGPEPEAALMPALPELPAICGSSTTVGGCEAFSPVFSGPGRVGEAGWPGTHCSAANIDPSESIVVSGSFPPSLPNGANIVLNPGQYDASDIQEGEGLALYGVCASGVFVQGPDLSRFVGLDDLTIVGPAALTTLTATAVVFEGEVSVETARLAHVQVQGHLEGEQLDVYDSLLGSVRGRVLSIDGSRVGAGKDQSTIIITDGGALSLRGSLVFGRIGEQDDPGDDFAAQEIQDTAIWAELSDGQTALLVEADATSISRVAMKMEAPIHARGASGIYAFRGALIQDVAMEVDQTVDFGLVRQYTLDPLELRRFHLKGSKTGLSIHVPSTLEDLTLEGTERDGVRLLYTQDSTTSMDVTRVSRISGVHPGRSTMRIKHSYLEVEDLSSIGGGAGISINVEREADVNLRFNRVAVTLPSCHSVRVDATSAQVTIDNGYLEAPSVNEGCDEPRLGQPTAMTNIARSLASSTTRITNSVLLAREHTGINHVSHGGLILSGVEIRNAQIAIAALPEHWPSLRFRMKDVVQPFAPELQ